MIGRRRQILMLTLISLVGVLFGIWLFLAGFALHGCVYIGVFLWCGQKFAVWLIPPAIVPIAIWRRRIGAISTMLGVPLFAAACFLYERYISNPSSSHLEERLRHAQAFGLIWSTSLLGSLLLFMVSLSGLGWSRWSGLLVNGGAFLWAVMTLGAMCGPFGCS
jgi:hypothetical protein